MLSATATFTPGANFKDALLEAVGRGVEAGARLVEAEAKATVTVDTGDVQSKIEARSAEQDRDARGGGDARTAVVVSGSDHGGYLEFGTGQRGEGSGPGPYDPNWPGMVAQPYLRQALDTCRDQVIEAIHAEVRGAF